jgi:hypothetical protein
VRVEIPANGHFADGISKFACQKQHLYIEGPTLNGLQRELVLRSFGAEAFEAALRILQPG